jgi:uncharacterized membrane-anchored protein
MKELSIIATVVVVFAVWVYFIATLPFGNALLIFLTPPLLAAGCVLFGAADYTRSLGRGP